MSEVRFIFKQTQYRPSHSAESLALYAMRAYVVGPLS